MSKDTTIEWCDSSVNPTMGCDGCELWSDIEKTCYAGILHDRYGGSNSGFAPTFDQVTEFPGRMKTAMAWSDLRGKDRPDKPWFNGMPRIIFVSDMSDALSAAVSFEYLKTEIIDNAVSPNGRRHILMWLTKQPTRMAKLSAWLKEQGIAWPANLWPGTSLTTQSTVPRVGHLANVGDETTTRFVSAEPLLGPVKLGVEAMKSIQLLISGGESGAGARPSHPDWFRDLRDQCVEAGVAYFFKQHGEWKSIADTPEAEYQKFYKPNRVAEDPSRQAEMDDAYGRHCTIPSETVRFDGAHGVGLEYLKNEGRLSYQTFKMGKKAAGRLLDGREWSEFPTPRNTERSLL